MGTKKENNMDLVIEVESSKESSSESVVAGVPKRKEEVDEQNRSSESSPNSPVMIMRRLSFSKEMRSSHDLIEYILDEKTPEEMRRRAMRLAECSIGLFRDSKQYEDVRFIREIVPYAKHPLLQAKVMGALSPADRDRLDPSEKIRFLCAYIEANRLTAKYCGTAVKQSDYLHRFKTVFSVLGEIYKADPDVSSLVIVLKGLGHLIDTLIDAGVNTLSKEDLKDPVYESLNDLVGHPDPEVSFLAAYAQQGLVRIPSDEPMHKLIMRKMGYVTNGLNSIKGIAYAISATILSGGATCPLLLAIPSECASLYTEILKIAHSKIKPATWYEYIRYVDAIFDAALDEMRVGKNEDPNWVNPHQSVKDTVKDDLYVGFYKGYIYRLEALVVQFKSMLKEEFFVDAVIKLFNFTLNNMNDSWLLGRLAVLVKKIFVSNAENEALTQRLLEFIVKIEERFRDININEKHSEEDLIKVLKDGLLVILFTNTDELRTRAHDFLNSTFNKVEKMLDVKKKSHRIKFSKSVGNVRKEGLRVWRFLLMFGTNNDREQVAGFISNILRVSDDKYPPKTALEKENLSQAERVARSEDFDFTTRSKTLLEAAKSKVKVDDSNSSQPDYFEFRVKLLGDDADHLMLRKLKEDYELYQPIEGRRNDYDAPQDMEGILREFLASEQTVMLVSGGAGSGKSLFSYNFARMLAREMPEKVTNKWSGFIPVIAFLPMIPDPESQLTSKILEGGDNFRYPGKPFNFSPDQVEHLRKHVKILFILDGYDELYASIDLFARNGLDNWSNAKFLVTCRTGKLSTLGKDLHRVVPRVNGRLKPELFTHFQIAPFSRIKPYIKRFLSKRRSTVDETLEKHNVEERERWYEAETYLEHIEIVNGLSELKYRPLLLSFIVELLPRYSIEYDAGALEKVSETKLFEDMSEEYFDRHYLKVELLDRENKPTRHQMQGIKDKMHAFAKKFAAAIQHHCIEGLPLVRVLLREPIDAQQREVIDCRELHMLNMGGKLSFGYCSKDGEYKTLMISSDDNQELHDKLQRFKEDQQIVEERELVYEIIKLIKQSGGRDPNRSTPYVYFNPDYTEKDHMEETGWYMHFIEFFKDLIEPDNLTAVLRSGCPVKPVAPYTWAFHAEAWREHFYMEYIHERGLRQQPMQKIESSSSEELDPNEELGPNTALDSIF